ESGHGGHGGRENGNELRSTRCPILRSPDERSESDPACPLREVFEAERKYARLRVVYRHSRASGNPRLTRGSPSGDSYWTPGECTDARWRGHDAGGFYLRMRYRTASGSYLRSAIQIPS